MKEVFKKIPEFEDYLVSNLGRVKTSSRLLRYTHAVSKMEFFRKTEERFLKVQSNERTGYKFYQLYRDKKMYNRTIHSLVSSAFLEKKSGMDYINHIDGNKHNNVVSNLERCTNSYNHKHATETGLKAKGESVGTSKLTDEMVHAIKWFLGKGFSHTELSKAFKISRPTISLINIGKTWKHIALTGEELEVKGI